MSRSSIWEKNKHGLPPTTLSSQLVVYQNQNAFDNRDTVAALDEEDKVTNLGAKKLTAVWVAVPTSHAGNA